MANTFNLEIICPDRMFYKGEAEMLEIVSEDGMLGIYAGHIPFTAVLMPGVARIHANGEIKEAAIHSGFMEILQDKITVLAEIAEWPEEIDLDRAKQAKERAEKRIKGQMEKEFNLKRAEFALRKSIARIKLVK